MLHFPCQSSSSSRWMWELRSFSEETVWGLEKILTEFFLVFFSFWCPNRDDFCVVLDFISKEQLSSLVAFQLSCTALMKEFRRLWWLSFTLYFPIYCNMQAGFSVRWNGSLALNSEAGLPSGVLPPSRSKELKYMCSVCSKEVKHNCIGTQPQ